ncbi:MAG: acyltransferase [Candidatus Lindowbacteria bacterium RIFCSPLOWO2_12_FULL_62_27]|nr:MAG: acyltransferase [Candidatus Lindowbacteria bacterium RIFCSPLOWO2_12_FULL_62_27]
MKKLVVGLVQHKAGESMEANTDKNMEGIREAARRGAGLVVMPELHRSRYFCQSEDARFFDWAEAVPGPSTERFGRLAKDMGAVLVISLFEKRATGLYHNTAVVLDRTGEVAGTYRKMHIPDDPQYYEKYYFAPGDSQFRPIATSVGKLGVMVCWDQWYPEPARLSALHGADVLVYPSAIGWEPADEAGEKERQIDSWVTVQRGHAIANGIPVMAANRVGFEPNPLGGSEGIDFWGSSFVAGCQGEIISRAASDREEIVMAELDLGASERVRRVWPFLRDRRIDAYTDLVRRYGGQ